MVVGNVTNEVDVVVVGGGPGGYVAAIRAAQLGKKVTLIERGNVGGVCLNVGCIPSKALISAAHRYEEMHESHDMGISAENVKLDFAKVQEWKDGIVKKQTGGLGMLFKGNKIEVVQGEAFFLGDNVISVSSELQGTRYQYNHCVIATGSRPIELKTFPFGGRVLSSTEALNLKEIPKSMVVIGGGYIGVELGQTYAKFGTQVTILEGSDMVLPGFEPELTRYVGKNLKKIGVEVVTNALAQSQTQTDKDITVTYTVNGEEKQVTAEYVLVTVGRRPNTQDIGLEGMGVKMNDRGYIEVDNTGRTSVSNVYAIGDIVAGPALAHKASYEGKVAAEAIAGHPSVIDYKSITAVVFSDPEIASVGYSESEAKEKGIEIVTGKFNYAPNGRAQALNKGEGFVKLVAKKENGVLIGAQIVGPNASDLIAELGLAVEMSATLEDIELTIHAHPTLGEIVKDAAEAALGHPIHSLGK
ncbi:dihydrolipoyl dehydrogenase [Paenibacillus turpanensis]|uniref:dihydrolipoyl dehydrogenase n=1 Tax=Paenibacillus turpanensis TaxID=2689078 RepID=UPI00140804CF|nr:dihydrolipoyl dehydrogenase [Paenibacillus turpanensis]